MGISILSFVLVIAIFLAALFCALIATFGYRSAAVIWKLRFEAAEAKVSRQAALVRRLLDEADASRNGLAQARRAVAEFKTRLDALLAEQQAKKEAANPPKVLVIETAGMTSANVQKVKDEFNANVKSNFKPHIVEGGAPESPLLGGMPAPEVKPS